MHRWLPLFVLALSSLAAGAAVPSDPLDALVRDSPFLPPAGGGRATAANEGGPLEFRSVVFERGKFVFSVYDQASQKSKWVRLGQQGDDLPFVARSYDREQDILTVEQHGRTMALKLQSGHVASQSPAGAQPPPGPSPLPTPGAPASPAAAAPPPNAAPAGAAAPVPAAATTMSPAESQRLQEMADEIRRRRQQPPTLPKR